MDTRWIRAAASVALGAALVAGCGSPAADPGTTPTPRSTAPAGPPAGAELAAVYAAALRSFGGRSDQGLLYLRDATCPDVAHQPGTADCGGRPIPVEVSAVLERLLRGWAELRLLTPTATVPAGATVVTLGPTTLTPTGVTQQVSYVCGPLCGQGGTLTLVPSGAAWRVTGQTGPRWIS